jgi:hypothetical protein
MARCGRRPSGPRSRPARRWLDVYCPGCHTCRAIDIRTIDRHPLASVGSLVLGLLVVRRCGAFAANHRVACVAASGAAVNPARRWLEGAARRWTAKLLADGAAANDSLVCELDGVVSFKTLTQRIGKLAGNG